MDLLAGAYQVFDTVLASLVYYLLLLLFVEAVLGMVWGEWRQTQHDQAQRLVFAASGLVLARILYLVAVLVASAGWVESWVLLPPFERYIDAASIGLLGWAFMPLSRRGARAWDVIFGVTLVVLTGVFAWFTMDWAQAAPNMGTLPDYNQYWQAPVWSLGQIGLLLLAMVAVVRSRDEGWAFLLFGFLAMAAGRVLQLLFPLELASFSVWERLSNLVGFLMLVVSAYTGLMVRLRENRRQLQDISQTSLDHMKSLINVIETSQQISASLDLPVVLDNAVKGIAQTLGADQCAIAFPEEGDPGQMRLVAIYNPMRQGRGEGVTFPLDYQAVVQHAMRRKKYVIGDEAENVQLKVLFALMGSSDVGPLLVHPLLDGSEAMGAMIVGNSQSQRPFTPTEAKLCQDMSEQLVISVRNARRHQAAQARVQKLTQELTNGVQRVGKTHGEVEELRERLAAAQAQIEEHQEQEELSREVRNALEIKLVSTRAEIEALTERLAVLDGDLTQAHANAEAQARWQQSELARREAMWRQDAQSAQWLQTVLQGMTAGLLVADADGKVREVNVAAELLLDRGEDELCTMGLQDIGQDERWRQAVTTVQGGEAVRLTTLMGSHTLLCDMAPLAFDPSKGQAAGIVAILQDISAEVGDRRDRLGNVLSLTAEMRTPLTSIISYVDLLLGEAVGIIGEGQRRFLLRTRAAAEQMLKMTSDLSRDARNRDEWLEPKRQVVDLLKVIEQVVGESSAQFKANAITVDLDLPQGLPNVEADPDHLRRVFANLLANAARTLAEGSKVEIDVGQLDSPAVKQSYAELNGTDYLVVSVKDTGGGLSDEALSQIFDQSQPNQADGLGEPQSELTLVRSLVEAQGGRLWVESESGVGTTFRVILPVHAPGNVHPGLLPTLTETSGSL